jgi:hypothetical protein
MKKLQNRKEGLQAVQKNEANPSERYSRKIEERLSLQVVYYQNYESLFR